MMAWIVKTLQHYPELSIFLTLALGYWAGRLKIGKFSLGSVTGVLLAGVLVGTIDEPRETRTRPPLFSS